METKNTPMQRKITQLAEQARGKRSRPEVVPLLGMSLGTYFNFEAGRVWPQAANLRKIEDAYGWQPGILTQLVGSDLDPAVVTLETLREGVGAAPAVSRAAELSLEELLAELVRRMGNLQDENSELRETVERLTVSGA